MSIFPIKLFKVPRIPANRSKDKVRRDLIFLRKLLSQESVFEASVIKLSDVIFSSDILVSLNDRCKSIHWPICYHKDKVEDAIKSFNCGLFFRLATLDDMPDYHGGPIRKQEHLEQYLKLNEIITKIESTAFYKGYHLSMGFTTGNCRNLYCMEEKRCWALIKGKKCIHPYKARPSMEAVGIDAFAMARKLKWNTHEEKNTSLLSGLVMIA